jgi:hypothetical protein
MTVRVIVVLGMLLGLVGAGYWLAGRDRAADGPPPLPLTVAEPCSVVGEGCIAERGAMKLRFRIVSEIQPMQPFEIELEVPDEVDAAGVDFTMVDMDMGLNRYRLVRGEDGLWRGNAMLPVCTTGRRDWLATLEIADDGTVYVAEFFFETQAR